MSSYRAHLCSPYYPCSSIAHPQSHSVGLIPAIDILPLPLGIKPNAETTYQDQDLESPIEPSQQSSPQPHVIDSRRPMEDKRNSDGRMSSRHEDPL